MSMTDTDTSRKSDTGDNNGKAAATKVATESQPSRSGSFIVFLTLVISIMCFLACLTAGAVYMINQSAAAWTRNIASEVTVQLQPLQGIDMEKGSTQALPEI